MFNPYLDNAFRVLGLTAEQTADDPPRFLHHLPGLPALSRDVAQTMARGRLADPDGRRRHASHWFLIEEPSDSQAMEALESGDLREARRIWSAELAQRSGSALQNSAILNHLIALGADLEQPASWKLWGEALRLWAAYSDAHPNEAILRETKLTIAEELVEHFQSLVRGREPNTAALVLNALRDGGYPPERLAVLEGELLGQEVEQLRYRCAKLRKTVLEMLKSNPPEATIRLAGLEEQMHEEVSMVKSIEAVTLSGSPVREKARESLALGFRALARAYDSLAANEAKMVELLQLSAEFANENLKAEIDLELSETRGRREVVTPPPPAAPRQEEPPPPAESAPSEPLPPEALPPEGAEAGDPALTAEEEEDRKGIPQNHSFAGMSLEMVVTNNYHLGAEDLDLKEGVYYLTVLGFRFFPIARYKLHTDMAGNPIKAQELPMGSGLLVRRALVIVLAVVAMGALLTTLVSTALPGEDSELERAALEAERAVLVERAGKAAADIVTIREKIFDLDSRLQVKPDPKMQGEVEQLKKELKHLEAYHRRNSDLAEDRSQKLRRLK